MADWPWLICGDESDKDKCGTSVFTTMTWVVSER